MTLPFLDRLFELFYSGTLLWNKGNNICVDLLLHIGACHDKVLQANQRQPCGSVAQVFRDAIPAWNEFETQRGWIRSDELKSQQKTNFEEAMTSDQRWEIAPVEVKGAVGWGVRGPGFNGERGASVTSSESPAQIRHFALLFSCF